MSDHGSEQGQASVELVALLPILFAVLLASWQGVLAGQAWWLVAGAARAGARADLVGADPLVAARRELPGGLRRGVTVHRGGGELVVRLAIPAIGGLGRVGTATARARAAETGR
jgi:hypothetical protein